MIQWKLRSKNTGEFAYLQELDETLCALIGYQVERYWVMQWYDSVGASVVEHGYKDALTLRLKEESASEPRKNETPEYYEWFAQWKARRVQIFSYLARNFEACHPCTIEK